MIAEAVWCFALALLSTFAAWCYRPRPHHTRHQRYSGWYLVALFALNALLMFWLGLMALGAAP